MLVCEPAMKKRYQFKIVVAGDGGVGKTSLLNRYVSNKFITAMKMTIGTDFLSKTLETEDWIIKLQLWDFGGEEEFRYILPYYYPGSHGVILAFDMNDFYTMMNLGEWLQIIRECTLDPVVILVGCKSDLADFLDEDLIQDFCLKNEIDGFIPTSSKTGENVERLFQEFARRILAKHMDF